MAGFDMQVSGLEEVQRLFLDSPSLIVDSALYKALDNAAGVIAAEVAATAPDGDDEELKESVIVVTGIDHEARGGTALVGFSNRPSERTGKPMDAIAYWVELGHVMLTHDGFQPKNGLQHVPAHPFIRPAFEAAGEQAMQVFANTLVEGLSKVLPTEED